MSGQDCMPLTESADDCTGVRVALLDQYAGALRRIRDGTFSIALPEARDSAMRQLGAEIGALAGVLEQRFDQISRLSQISLDMNAGLMLDEILERAYQSFRGVIPYDRIGCALIDHAAWAVRARWARTEAAQVCIGQGYEQPLTGSSLEEIISSGRPRILNDLERYLAEHADSDATRRIVSEGMRSSLTCPLVARGRPIGFLFFSSLRANTYDPEHAHVFAKIAEQLSVVVEKSLLYQRLLEVNEQLTDSQRQLEYQATHDGMTGLPNRTAILARLDQAAARSARGSTSFGVLMLDIDHFKRFNDSHGHLAGDAAIRQVGKVLADATRTGESIGRYGGEEFLAVLESCDVMTLQRAAERFRRAIGDSIVQFEGRSLPVTVSIGGALSSRDGSSCVERLIATADAGLYAAKAAGRNCVVINPPAGEAVR
jgi:diguanylate cyclase (GGDEF)-like protein